MAESPLVPAPELPWRFDGVEVLPNSSYTYVRISDDDQCAAINLAGEHAITLAAAILAAAELTTYRVIDLGGELPEVKSGVGDVGLKRTYIQAADGLRVYDDIADADVMEDVRSNLAVLEARAVAPSHDPAEVQAVQDALQSLRQPLGARDRAIAILDALAAARTARDAS